MITNPHPPQPSNPKTIYGIVTAMPDPRFPETMVKTMIWGERRPKGKYLCFATMEAMESHCRMNDLKMIKA